MALINNTGNSRQVRRAREREFANPRLSVQLESVLARLEPGKGVFQQMRRGYKLYSPGYISERRNPEHDYSERYAALFKVLPG